MVVGRERFGVEATGPMRRPEACLESRDAGAGNSPRFGRLVGKSEAMLRLFDLLRRASASDATVVLDGETGTGKRGVGHRYP